MKVEVCYSPALYPFYEEDGDRIVVVVDIFRASTTMCTAFLNGVDSIIPVASIDEAREYKNQGYLVGAERNVKRCDFADFGNSPFDYTADRVAGKEVAFTTTNGTKAINIAADHCHSLIVGAFSNISAVADYCIAHGKDVVILCAGWNNRFCIEDSLYGGALSAILATKGGYNTNCDATQVALAMWNEAKADPRRYIDRTEHIKRLEANNMQDSVDYCLTQDTVPMVPIYNTETRKLKLG